MIRILKEGWICWITVLSMYGGMMASCGPRPAERYAVEADHFLKQMPVGLQDRQCAAIRKAMAGDTADLQAVRNGRNAATPLNEAVQVTEVSANLRLYVPKERKSEVLPLLVYLHGGGWTFGSINSCARYCSELAATGKVMVLAVNYRLAPEHPYPCGLNDCVEAILFAREQAQKWGSAPHLVSVGGDSSGGNLALCASLSLLQNQQPLPHSLVLYYPVVSAWNDGSESWKKYATGHALDGEIMDAFNAAYCEGVNHQIAEDAHRNALISPAVATDEDLRQLPPILFTAAERDILFDQGKAFTERVCGLGVKVRREVLPGTVHLFITVPGQERAFRESVRSAAEFLSGDMENGDF